MLAGHVQAEYLIHHDRRTLEAILRLDVESPVEDFSSRLSEILHHFRGALDGLAWELAHADGLTPSKPNQIYFPTASDPALWPALAKHLSTISPDAVSRLEASQPYHQARPDLDVLSVLARLNNADKHRDLISANLAPSFAATVNFRLDADGSPYPGEPDIKLDFPETPALKDGSVQIRMTAGRPVIYSARSELKLTGLEWQVTDGSLGRLGLESLIDALVLQIPLVMGFVRNGGTHVSRQALPEHTSGMSGTFQLLGVPAGG